MDERSERVAKRFEVPLLVAALLVIPMLFIEGSRLDDPWPLIGDVLNWTIWLAFVAEFVVMMAIVPSKKAWLRRHPLEIAIVFLTPPFLPESLQAARVFRVLRLLALVRLALLVRRLLSPEGVRDAAVLAVFVVLGGGAAFAAVENEQNLTTWDGVWWAATTVTTVGYGDIQVQTHAGRMIAIVVMVVGIGFVAMLTAAAAERLIRTAARQEAEDELEALRKRVAALEGATPPPPPTPTT